MNAPHNSYPRRSTITSDAGKQQTRVRQQWARAGVEYSSAPPDCEKLKARKAKHDTGAAK